MNEHTAWPTAHRAVTWTAMRPTARRVLDNRSRSAVWWPVVSTASPGEARGSGSLLRSGRPAALFVAMSARVPRVPAVQRRSIAQGSGPGVYLNKRCLLRYGRSEGLVPSVAFQHVPMHNNAMGPGRASGQVVFRVGRRSLQRGTLGRLLVRRGRMIEASTGAL